MMLQPLVPKVGEHKMERVSKVEKIGNVKEIEKWRRQFCKKGKLGNKRK